MHSLGRISVKKFDTPSPSITITVVISKEEDGYVAYPLEIPHVVADGKTYKDVCKNIKDAIKFHIETFGSQVLTDIPKKHTIETTSFSIAKELFALL